MNDAKIEVALKHILLKLEFQKDSREPQFKSRIMSKWRDVDVLKLVQMAKYAQQDSSCLKRWLRYQQKMCFKLDGLLLFHTTWATVKQYLKTNKQKK